MTETENLFEIYDSVNQLHKLSVKISSSDYKDMDSSLKFLNLVPYHKPLFEDIESAQQYQKDVVKKINYYFDISNTLHYIFARNHTYEFPEDIYNQYYKYPNYDIKFHIVVNSYTPKNILEKFVNDDDFWIKDKAKIILNTRFGI